MIRQTNFTEGHPEPLVLDRTPVGALSCLISEIGMGGRILDVTATRVLVEAVVLDRTDETHFEGLTTDMLPLARVAVAFRTALTIGRDHAIAGACRTFDGIPNGGNAFLVANLGPMLVGRRIATITMACAFFDLGVEDETTLRAIAALPLDDQCAVFIMAHEDPGTPVADLVALAA